MARLAEKYKEEVVPAMMERFGYTNVLAVPRLEKLTASMGVGKVIENAKRMDSAVKDIALVTGQHPLMTKSRKSVSGFRLRLGMTIGCKVTLRRRRMYEFLDRLISVVIPRIRDFRGFPVKGFDGRGNYSMGLTEQIVFPEIKIDDVEFVQGMNVAFTVSGSSDEESAVLLELLGFPFRK